MILVPLEQDQRFTLDRDERWAREKFNVKRWDLDVAACKESHLAAKYFTAQQNALAPLRRWDAGLRGEAVIWANIPFSNVWGFVRRAWQAMARSECRKIVMLAPQGRTEQRGWQELVEPFRRREPRRLGRGGPLVDFNDHCPPWRLRFGRPGNRHALTKSRVGEDLGVGSPDFTCVFLVWERLQTSAGVLS